MMQTHGFVKFSEIHIKLRKFLVFWWCGGGGGGGEWLPPRSLDPPLANDGITES